MVTLTVRAFFSIFFGTIACAAFSQPAAVSGPHSPLPAASTIQVDEQTYFTDNSNNHHPYLYSTQTVRFARPNQYWIEEHITKPTATEHPSVLVSDGTSEYQYDGTKNVYVKGIAPKPGGIPADSLMFLYVSARMGIILDPKLDALTWTSGQLDGKAMWVNTHIYPTFHDRGVTFRTTRSIWEDASTGLPYRWCLYTAGGKVRTTIQLDFSHWVLNQPLPPSSFAWTPPADAKPYAVPPTPVLLTIGTVAPDFAAITPAGRTVHLSDLKGTIVILDFWATWCGPCQASMPHLEHVYQQVKGQGVSVLAVCDWDQKATYQQWVAAKKKTYTFPTAFDSTGIPDAISIASRLYGVNGIPTQYVIDKTGKIAAIFVGYDPGEHRLDDALNKMGIVVQATKK